MNDVSFDKGMPRGQTTKQKIMKEVWTAKFFKEVHFQRTSHIGIQNFTFGANELGPPGTRVMLSRRGLQELLTIGVLQDAAPDTHRRTIGRTLIAPTKPGDLPERKSWLQFFKFLIKSPKKAVLAHKMDLELILTWQQVPHLPSCTPSLPCRKLTCCACCLCAQTFHVMKPIQCKAFKVGLIRRLAASGARLTREALDKPQEALLYSCSCENYLHYGWCIHVNLQAFGPTGVMREYPKSLNPHKIKAVAKGRVYAASMGRIPRAKKGGALGYE